MYSSYSADFRVTFGFSMQYLFIFSTFALFVDELIKHHQRLECFPTILKLSSPLLLETNLRIIQDSKSDKFRILMLDKTLDILIREIVYL